jgi:hypothetical protein
VAWRCRRRRVFAGSEVVANDKTLRETQDGLEAQLITAPAVNREEAADKVRYLLCVFATNASRQDHRRKILIKVT